MHVTHGPAVSQYTAEPTTTQLAANVGHVHANMQAQFSSHHAAVHRQKRLWSDQLALAVLLHVDQTTLNGFIQHRIHHVTFKIEFHNSSSA